MKFRVPENAAISSLAEKLSASEEGLFMEFS
jgi:hypothetical protein